ncbi:hypothetical protein P168DRAFT_135894 [Aspergillus campestris IBT 28561]|uniref:F-box domain-containing protein n=1 Tax=Aspergillus campestris (strain IBT 28561) TaxID=1392248 RepID=A0A2I1D8C6_ASPC2|nr:uncharacterized protein P168DRAFT_135894 [Aspergillus campestris IBT 28561]PKY06125.1 hypothetical protein P168DRAFT_135894 [Aspergillus campestris IBT 28561]
MSAIHKTSESTYIFLDIKDNTLDDIDKASHADIRLDSDLDSPRYGLGALEKLPLEIVHLALVRLDVRSLTVFGRVNKRARLVTNSIPQFRRILVHAPALIRGSLNIESARFFSCQDLYRKLSTAECDSCGDFGGYLYLVTCRRVCFLCFTARADYLPLSRKDVTRKLGLDSKHIVLLPHMKSFPGRYSPRAIKCRRRETLFDYSAARQAGIAIHGTVESMEKYALEMISKKLENYNLKLSGSRTGGAHLRPPRYEDLFDGHCSNPRRFMGIIRAPYFDSQLPSPEWGLHCIACKSHHYRRPIHWRRKYTISGFQDHVRECGEIKDGQHVPSINVEAV